MSIANTSETLGFPDARHVRILLSPRVKKNARFFGLSSH